MKDMNVKNIALACGGSVYNCCNGEIKETAASDISDKETTCAVIDSRLIQPSGLFIATKGERVDGHDYIESVFEKGALAVICEKLPDKTSASQDQYFILVKNSLQALKDIATFYRTRLNCRIIGITGSVGKTSTKEMIASVLRQGKSVCATEGNFNNEIGVPLTILRIREDNDCAVVEMGINHFGEMTRLTNIVKPDHVVMTNIGECHLENLGDREGVLRAKSEIFECLSVEGRAILNASDDKLAGLSNVNGKIPIRYAFEGTFDPRDLQVDYVAKDIEDKGLSGSVVTITGPDGFNIRVHVPLPGRHMILNAMAAAAAGTLFGLTPDLIKKGIEEVNATGGRSNVIKAGDHTIIDDCYNANPTSVRAALDLLATASGHRTAILGDMFELGVDEKKLHEEIGAYAVKGKTDTLICVGELSENMVRGAEDALKKAPNASAPGADPITVHYFKTVDDLLETPVNDLITPVDTILIKASHSMKFERIVKALT
ncbi:MAG: UDP-N-acetylmuramoyl-tripeptide--D-alanyl-D-alanine ligase [Lachnospiraceae bacterium]|nr:UDP-N-acetylmuramoyl-tripeptide--D-alanyl-D-alanine ligase [Lachnospiraceae bacterium]